METRRRRIILTGVIKISARAWRRSRWKWSAAVKALNGGEFFRWAKWKASRGFGRRFSVLERGKELNSFPVGIHAAGNKGREGKREREEGRSRNLFLRFASKGSSNSHFRRSGFTTRKWNLVKVERKTNSFIKTFTLHLGIKKINLM